MAGESVLIIDDNPINLKLENILLSIEGYDIRLATDAEEALQILKTFTPRLILMDLQLPGLSGLDLTHKIRSNPQLKDVIIIAVTAYAMKGDKEKAIAAGCNGYITKPIDTKSFPEVLARYLRS